MEFQVDLPILDKDLQNTDHPAYKKEKGPWTFIKKESNLLKDNCLITIKIQKESYIIDTIFTLSHSLKAKQYFDCIQHLFLKIESLIGDSKELVIIDSYAYLRTGCCFKRRRRGKRNTFSNWLFNNMYCKQIETING